MKKVWALGVINLKPGILKFFCWSKDFDPLNQTQTHAQLWIRLMHLPQEYWRKTTLLEIASGIGTPLAIDEATQSRLFGHYARVLVDVDLSDTLFEFVLVEREGYEFPVTVEYERKPVFCLHCKMIGHSIQQCYRINFAKSQLKSLSVLNATKVVQHNVSTSAVYVAGKPKEGNSSAEDKDSEFTNLVNAAKSKVVTFSTVALEQNCDVENYMVLHNSFDMLQSDTEELEGEPLHEIFEDTMVNVVVVGDANKTLNVHPLEVACLVSGTSKKAYAPAETGCSPFIERGTKQLEKLYEVGRVSFPCSASSSMVKGDIAGDVELQEEPFCDNTDSFHATKQLAASTMENIVAVVPSNSSLVPGLFGLDSTLLPCAMPQPITTYHISLTADKRPVLEPVNTLRHTTVVCSSEAQRSVEILQKF